MAAYLYIRTPREIHIILDKINPKLTAGDWDSVVAV